MTLLLAVQTDQLPPAVADELDQSYAAIQTWSGKVDGAGKWVHIPFDPKLFTSFGGTWIPIASNVYLLAYSVVGTTMTVAFTITAAAMTGVVSKLRIRIPAAGYQIQPIPIPAYVEGSGAGYCGTCSIWEDLDTYKPGIVTVDNTDTANILLQIFPTAEGNINTTGAGGCFGQISFEVKPTS